MGDEEKGKGFVKRLQAWSSYKSTNNSIVRMVSQHARKVRHAGTGYAMHGRPSRKGLDFVECVQDAARHGRDICKVIAVAGASRPLPSALPRPLQFMTGSKVRGVRRALLPDKVQMGLGIEVLAPPSLSSEAS